MSCGVAIMKFTLIFFNVIFLLIGIAGVALGIWIAVSPSTIFEMLQYNPDASAETVQTSAYIFIAGCAFILIVSALGIFGACTGNRCLLGFYGFFVILIFAIELAALITAIVYDQQFRDELKTGLYNELINSYKTGARNQKFIDTVNEFQREFECCGIRNHTDYDTVTLTTEEKNNGYPKFCYPHDDSPNNNLFTTGCYTKLREKIKAFGAVIIGIVVSVLCLR
ncbi:tetraspanin-18-like [Liolophura sinensis]|uniref:tetraspanin-18-like n=1 Tax=Liolophura sinensis TaxID=3198878 RepID=UPI0031593D04